MDKHFDELSKSLMEECVSRRAALMKFGVGLASMILASVGFAGGAGGQTKTRIPCSSNADCAGNGSIYPACCKSYCADLYQDPQNCGVCGHHCGPKQGCQEGICFRAP